MIPLDPADAAKLCVLELQLMRGPARVDPAFLDATLDDDFVEIGSSGRVYDKAACIAQLLGSSGDDDAREASDMHASGVVDGVALVRFQVCALVAPGVERRSLRSSWWRRSPRGWRLFFHQSTVVPAVAP